MQRTAVVREPEPAPVRKRLFVRHLDVQRDVLDSLVAEVGGEVSHELLATPLPADLGPNVDEADVTRGRAGALPSPSRPPPRRLPRPRRGPRGDTSQEEAAADTASPSARPRTRRSAPRGPGSPRRSPRGSSRRREQVELGCNRGALAHPAHPVGEVGVRFEVDAQGMSALGGSTAGTRRPPARTLARRETAGRPAANRGRSAARRARSERTRRRAGARSRGRSAGRSGRRGAGRELARRDRPATEQARDSAPRGTR